MAEVRGVNLGLGVELLGVALKLLVLLEVPSPLAPALGVDIVLGAGPVVGPLVGPSPLVPALVAGVILEVPLGVPVVVLPNDGVAPVLGPTVGPLPAVPTAPALDVPIGVVLVSEPEVLRPG